MTVNLFDELSKHIKELKYDTYLRVEIGRQSFANTQLFHARELYDLAAKLAFEAGWISIVIDADTDHLVEMSMSLASMYINLAVECEALIVKEERDGTETD